MRSGGRFRHSALDCAAMSRVVRLTRPSARRIAAMVAVLASLVVVSFTSTLAQEAPACADGSVSECRLPGWPDPSSDYGPSLFGEIAGVTWVEDPDGDAPPSGLEILAAGVGSVDIADPAAVRGSDELLKAGKVKRAVRPGAGVLVRIVLDRPLSEIESGHAGVHVATDIDGSRSNNAPAVVGAVHQPFAGSEDVYSVTYATTSAKTKLLDSDLSAGWYEDDDAFAASWAAPNVLDLLVRPEGMGDGLRVVTFVSGADGGYDTLTIGPGPIPVDGDVGLLPLCVEGSMSTQPFVVRRLVENGQTLRNVEAPASWHGGGAIPLDDDARSALEAFVGTADEDGDGRIALPSTVSLFEDGVVIRQRPELELALDDKGAQLALELGLTRRGYNVLREVEVKPTGDDTVDAWLGRATTALSRTMPPFRSGRKAGLITGDGIGSCVPLLISAPAPMPDEIEAAASDAPSSPSAADASPSPSAADASPSATPSEPAPGA